SGLLWARRGDQRGAQSADTLDPARQDVPGSKELRRSARCADAGWSSREDEISRQQRAYRRKMSHELGNREDQVRCAALLKDFAALQCTSKLQVIGIVNLIDGHQFGAQRRKATVGLAQRELWCRTGELQSSFGEVLADGEARDVIPCIARRDVVTSLSDHSD